MALFAAAIFLGAFLMFSIEPMVAKILLPRLGGTPMVWNTCMVFFQSVLLGGYLCAHLIRRARSWGAAIVFIGLATAAAATLPVSFPAQPDEAANPGVWLFLQLTRSLGPAFFVLAAAGPTLQTWFSWTSDRRASDPYFLYAASNAGSFAALLAYPLLIEPNLTLASQRRIWAGGYVVLVASVAFCAWRTWQRSTGGAARTPLVTRATVTAGTSRVRERTAWFALAVIPSSLMLGVTTFISTDVAAVPLIWVAPLALYLLTFVLAFGSTSARVTTVAMRRYGLPLTAVVFLMATDLVLPVAYVVLLHLLAFFVVSLMCHGLLANRRPSADRLTEFYLLISAGGVAGGLFNVLVAPVLFTTSAEYPLVLLGAAAIPAFFRNAPPKMALDIRSILGPVLVGASAAAATFAVVRWALPHELAVLVFGGGALYAFSQFRRPIRFACVLAALCLASAIGPGKYGTVLFAERTFFGIYHVGEVPNGEYRSVFHGTTLHGTQAVSASAAAEPLTYYHRAGPFGQAYAGLDAMQHARRVAVVGLGIGTLSAYSHPGQHWTFFEIDPAVERIARDDRFFSFLRRCADHCDVVLGDARLSLSREPVAQFGLIVLDAFSSDAIPVHLLTDEAFGEYLSHLEPGGVLMVHVSNRYLDLVPLLAGVARSRSIAAFHQFQFVGASGETRIDSHWVAMAPLPETLGALSNDPRWLSITSSGREVLWTDEYSNILSVLKGWH